jgi:dienelactone hydrolase
MEPKFVLALLLFSRLAFAQVPGAQPLTMEGDLSAQMVAGIDKFLMRQLADSVAHRTNFWKRDFASAEAYEKSVQTNREHLRRIIGAVDSRLPIRDLEFVSTIARDSKLGSGENYTIQAIRWEVYPKVYGEGLWLRPNKKPIARVIAIPDADHDPELLCGLQIGIPADSQFARRLAEQGIEVIVPQLINRSDTFSGDAALKRFTNQPHREWIYRQAYEMGRHIIGYEVQKILSLVDFFASEEPAPIAVAGYGEGGLLALYSAALDTRIQAALVSGYFGAREKMWDEPIYRNVFSLLKEFGDAELASLVAPRTLVIEYSQEPDISGPPAPQGGRSGAAPGHIWTPERYDVEGEINRARKLFPADFKTQFDFVYGNEGQPAAIGSTASLEKFCAGLGVKSDFSKGGKAPIANGPPIDTQERQRRQVEQLVDFTQSLLRDCELKRDAQFWSKTRGVKADDWPRVSADLKRQLWDEVLGRFPRASLPANPRAREIYDEPKWKGYDVVLDLWPDVYAWGVLLLPKDLKPGEKRPVVVCQHGLEGVPRDTIDPEGKTGGYGAYKSFSARLAERGFIVFAPHNPYRGHDAFRVLQRKANPLGKSLFSVILAQHEIILNWLGSLPFVDKSRIGFYGLSYGGKTAMRVPSLLEKYALSICSADFNEWVTKNATVHSPYSYMFGGEYEMPEFNLGHTFNYAEMAALIAPRPFMVERGHDDGVAPDEWVAHEFARVRRHYDRLGIGDRTTIEFFNGPHTINGQGTFKFLHQHLNWPEPEQAKN